MLIGLCGLKWNGKTTSALHLVSKHNFVHMKFALPLKNMLRQLYRDVGLDDATIERKIEGDLKEVVCEVLGVTPVHAMQTLGTEWGRDCIKRTLWGDLWQIKAQHLLDCGKSVVVDDVRFENEYHRVKNMGGYVVKIVGRSNVVNPHKSEDLSWLTEPDAIIENNSTPDHLFRQLDRMVGQILNEVWG